MKKLLSIELKKILPYATFWIIMGIYFVLLFLVFFFLRTIKIQGPLAFLNLQSYYIFPVLWHSLTYVASFFTLLLGMIVIILSTNEFMFRTIRQNIIDGLSKVNFLVAKLLLIFGIALLATFIVFFTGLINGFTQTNNIVASMVFEKIDFVVAYFVQAIAYMCFALFVGTLVKKSGLAIGIFLLYSKIVEPLIGWKLPSEISDYLPFHTISGLIQNPALKLVGFSVPESPLGIHFVFSLIYSAVFVGGTYLLLTKRDL
jgi:ABC-2 type transport system permease protein